MSKKSIFTVGIASLSLVAVMGLALVLKPSSVSAAQLAVDNSRAAVQKLSAEERMKAEENIKYDPAALLSEARAADSLAEVPCATTTPPESAKSGATIETKQVGNASAPTSAYNGDTCFSYDRNDGTTVVFGLDSDKIPVTMTVSR